MAHPDVSNRKPIVNAFTAKTADSFVSYYVRAYIGIYLILSIYIRNRQTDSKTSYSGDYVGFFLGTGSIKENQTLKNKRIRWMEGLRIFRRLFMYHRTIHKPTIE